MTDKEGKKKVSCEGKSCDTDFNPSNSHNFAPPPSNLNKLRNSKENEIDTESETKKSESKSPSIDLEKFVSIISKDDVIKYGTPEAELIASFMEEFSNQCGRNLSLNALGNIYGQRNRFYRNLKDNTIFLERTVEQLETMANTELTGDNLVNVLDSINKYRKTKNYLIFNEAPNKGEIILITTLRKLFEIKLSKILTLSDLEAKMDLSQGLFYYPWKNGSNFKLESIDIIKKKVNQLLEGKLRAKALNALYLYKEERQYKRLEDYLEDPNYSDYVPELELIIILRQNFSEQINEIISLSALGALLMNNKGFFRLSLTRQTSFRDSTLRAFRTKINEILTGSIRKETLGILNNYDNLNRSNRKQSERQTNLWKNPEYRANQEFKHQTDEYLSKMRGESHPRWISDRTQKDIRGHTIRFRYLRGTQIEFLLNQQLGLDGLTGAPFTEYDVLHRHHIDDNKTNDALKNLILLTANTHGTVPKSTNPKGNHYFKLLSENKQDFIDGVAPRNWSKEARELFNAQQIKKVDLRDFF